MDPLVYLIRTRMNVNDGTLGHLIYQDFHCFILERPWLDNKNDISCIPGGLIYSVKWQTVKNWQGSDKEFQGYQILDVKGRTGIFMHCANVMTEIEGCLAYGNQSGLYTGQEAKYKGKYGVWYSRQARQRFEGLMAQKPFRLQIEDRWATA